jgi:hypothetical protein
MGRGLLHSFSRGAWLATFCGVGYLTVQLFKSRFGTKLQLLSVVALSIVLLGFWQFRYTGSLPVRRAFSAANINDFSWRNRVAAWNGALHMMRDRLFFGFGWGKTEPVYGQQYCPPQIENGAAIQMNDYFMLGVSSGVPVLVCFLVYVGLSLRGAKGEIGREVGDTRSACPTLEWLQTTFRAGAIVLLVGFFFDGALFKLPTGALFWILLELGRIDICRAGAQREAGSNVESLVGGPCRPAEISSVGLAPAKVIAENGAQETAAPYRRTKLEIWLRRGAWMLGIAAASESAILLGIPFFGVNNTTVAISRHYLVPPSAVADLNLLTTNVDWTSRKLRPLLQHSSLANYDRQLINWKLDQQIYRDFVLNPLIDPQRDGQLAWRRKLWEYFYLPMRKENDSINAARIVLRFLHQRIAIVPQGPVTIDEMWREKRADERGIHALEVATFRSVGVPARLSESGRAELFSNGKWQTLPESISSTSESR